MGATHFIQRLKDFKANSWLENVHQQTAKKVGVQALA
jgi:hypothetical protein